MATRQEGVALLSSDDACSVCSDSSEDEVRQHCVSPLPVPVLNVVETVNTVNAVSAVNAAAVNDLLRTAQPPPLPPRRSSHLHNNMTTMHAQVPTISVTPHSPGVLDDSLQQLRGLQAAVQRMRCSPTPILHLNGSRLSSSCPSLDKVDGVINANATNILDNVYSPSPMSRPNALDYDYYYPSSRKGSGSGKSCRGWWWIGGGGDDGRRRSWAALEPAPPTGDNRAHRSMSLSSMESDGDEIQNARGRTLIAERRARPAHSTHSLNEADLQKDFEKVAAALRSGLSIGSSTPGTESLSAGGVVASAVGVALSGADCNVARLQPRLTLQKSVSTPSIVAAIQPMVQPAAGGLNATSYDHHSEKRRKRGSLFFRKKKDKSRKACHAWQPSEIPPSGGLAVDCDWCGRAIADRPAFHCDNCLTTVHQNICKDNVIECSKPKTSKTSVAKSLSSVSNKSTGKRSSVTSQAQSNTSSSSHFGNDEKDSSDHRHDQSNVSDDASTEWPEAQITIEQLGPEAVELELGAIESETWGSGAPKTLLRSLTDRELRRQEHIYELILTEKHHCLTILLMQKMFVEGITRCGGPGGAALCARVFPRLSDVWKLHMSLLGALRKKQRCAPAAAPLTHTIADVLMRHFTGSNAAAFKSAYGEFCSRHREAVDLFKESCARDPRIARFIRRCQSNTLLRKKGVPECVLFVAQRLTKYPLLIEPLIKTAGDDQLERNRLHKALAGVKEILVDIDGQVAAKEREDRKLEIYHKIDAKSCVLYGGTKFKKSDILQENRSLEFEGIATLMQGRSKMQTVMVIVLTDVLFFLHDNNNKYTFFTPDNKTGVVSLQKLLVREKAGADGRGLYLICSSPSEPEMFELRIHKPKDKNQWIQAIRAAVQTCPEEEVVGDVRTQSAEDRQRQLEQKQEDIRQCTEALRTKDAEHAMLLEEKMTLQMRLMALSSGINHLSGTYYSHNSSGLDSVNESEADLRFSNLPPGLPAGVVIPDYVRLASPNLDTAALWQEVCKAVKEATEWCQWRNDLSYSQQGDGGVDGLGLASGMSGTPRRSTSSAGERHSVAYSEPALPKRADTFGGFDGKGVAHRPVDGDNAETSSECPESEPCPVQDSQPDTTNHLDKQADAEPLIKLQHCIYTLMCLIWQQLTTIHSLEARVSVSGGSLGSSSGSTRWAELQLEELREAQARLTAERAAWETQRNAETEALAVERAQIAKESQELKEKQKDVEEQRERLYRRLEMHQQQAMHQNILTQGGRGLGSQEEITIGLSETSPTDSTRRKEPKWKSNRSSTGSEAGSIISGAGTIPGGMVPPPQLLSAQNERRVTATAPVSAVVKQQIPLKLASGKTGNLQTNQQFSAQSAQALGYHRLQETPSSEHPPPLLVGHSRTGSSPVTTTSINNNKATRTNTYPKLPDKFRVRSPEAAYSQSPQHLVRQQQQQETAQQDEEVIFF